MDTTQTAYFVTGIKENLNAEKAKQAISAVPGYEDSKFDCIEGTVIVTGTVDPQAICYAFSQAGYPAVVKSG